MEKIYNRFEKPTVEKDVAKKLNEDFFLNLTQFCILIFMELCFLGINCYYEIITAVHSDSEVLTLIKRQKLKLKSS